MSAVWCIPGSSFHSDKITIGQANTPLTRSRIMRIWIQIKNGAYSQKHGRICCERRSQRPTDCGGTL